VWVLAHDFNCVVEVNTVVVHWHVLTDALAGILPASLLCSASGIGCCMLAVSLTLHADVGGRCKRQLTYDWLLMSDGCAKPHSDNSKVLCKWCCLLS